MPQSLAQIYLHLIFSTKGRTPILHPEIRPRLYPYVAAICESSGSPALEIGGTADHIHILCRLGRTISVADLLKDIKSPSSAWLASEGCRDGESAWQTGYGAFSIGQSQIADVRAYIQNQEAHHRNVTFQDEYRKFMHRYDVQYDERYVWD